MFEYAISCGEGTLLDYGMIEGPLNRFVVPQNRSPFAGEAYYMEPHPDAFCMVKIYNSDEKMVFAPASPDCETGE